MGQGKNAGVEILSELSCEAIPDPSLDLSTEAWKKNPRPQGPGAKNEGVIILSELSCEAIPDLSLEQSDKARRVSPPPVDPPGEQSAPDGPPQQNAG